MQSGLSLQQKDKRIVAGLLILNALVRGIVALRPIEYLDGLVIPDDAYLSLTIARNIARGLGPLYGLEHTNGFQPLYVFLMVPFFWLFPTDYFAPIRASFFLLIAFDTAALYVLYRLVQKLSATAYPPRIVAAAWIVSPYVIGTTLNGLETMMAVFFMLASLSFFHAMIETNSGSSTTGRHIVLGILLGLAILARIDNGFLALSVVAAMLWGHRKRNGLVRSLLLITLGSAIIVIPWLLYSYTYTGLIYPISGKAVRFNSLWDVQHQPTLFNLYLPMMRRAAGVLVRKNGMHLLVLAIIAFFVVRKEGVRAFIARFHTITPVLLFVLLLVGAYTCYIFTSWFYERYLFPIGVVVFLVMGIALDRFFLHYSSHRTGVRWAGILVVVLVVLNIMQPTFRDLITSTDTQTRGYMNLGLWARREFPEGTILGAQQSGAIGYFADNLRVINLDGVVNASCYRSLVERRNMDYIKAMRIQYIVGWKVDFSFIKGHSTRYAEDDLQLVKELDGFTSWNQPWYLFKVNLRH